MSEGEKRRLSLSRRTATIAVPTIAALGAGGAFAVAAIPAGDGTINACYATNGLRGALRVVDGPSDCTRFETAISWNQKGPKGDPGPQGIPGPQGDKGDPGPAGANGSEAILIGGEALNSGRAVGFLDLDGIKGESTDDKHAGQIDIKSFGFGVKNTGSAAAGTGAGAGKATFSTFHFNKLYDVSSPKLLQDAASGKHIPSATFTFRRAGGDQHDFLTIKLSDVIVTDYEQGGTAEPPLLESVSLDAGKVQVTYQSQSRDGSPGDTSQFEWDLGTSKSF